MYFEILISVIMRLRMMNLGLIIDLEYFQFDPLILRIYILVHEILKKLQFGPWFVLERTEDGLQVKFQYDYVFTVQSFNFGKIMFWSLFWKIVVLVPKHRRVNLVLFHTVESLNCVVFLVYFVYLLQVLLMILNSFFGSFI